MKYDFDSIINRENTNSVKWDFRFEEGKPSQWDSTYSKHGAERVLPLWVADMDFICPQSVIDALEKRARHGIFGYTRETDAYYEAVQSWFKRRQGWQIDPSWITITPGVVPAVYMLVQAFVKPGEKVIIQTPVYYPFYSAVEGNDAVVVRNPLLYEEGFYKIDFANLEKSAQSPDVRMIIISSPHNPVGRVWTREELNRMGEICKANDILMVSDEIHSDLIMPGYDFVPFPLAGKDFESFSVVCTAPSKTFNIAGLRTSNIIIANETIRRKFLDVLNRSGIHGISPFGMDALIAAYNEGEEWLEQVLTYIHQNYEFLKTFFQKNLPEIDVIQLEGTYLVWLDCRRLGLDSMNLESLMLEDARLYLDEGYIFGSDGEGFERINIACPRSLLEEALHRLLAAVRAGH
ncbi:MAG: pyridoxal phosphate-dependent aminotransferase [Anaerolineales bacterium]|nr:pyridoxal phosphate-dependent aminotransferase [Anaerolineales bacterium]